MNIKALISLWTLVLLLMSAVVCGQGDHTELSINYRADNQDLKGIFLELEKEYDIRFSYSSEAIVQKRKNCRFVDSSLDEVLDYLLDDVEYKRIGNNVLLRRARNQSIEQDERYKSSLHVRGTVVVEGGAEKIPFASVSIENGSIGTFTDESGDFELEIPAAFMEDSLVVHYLGMEDKKYLIRDFSDEYKLIPLSTSDIEIDEIIIVNRKKKISILDNDNALMISLRDNVQSGILGDDLTRNLQKLAGVSASDDSSAEIKIRGSQSSETLIILDEMPIYNCAHFYGVFNSINTNYIDQIKLFKSHFPIEYGGKTGGVVHLASSQKLLNQSHLDVEADLMMINAMTGLKISDNINLTLAGRSTLRDISNTQFNSFSNAPDTEERTVQSFSDQVNNNRSKPSFSFYDLNTKLLWKLSSKQTVSFNAFNSGDKYRNEFKRTIEDPGNNKEIKLDALEAEEWNNLSSSINHTIAFGKKSSLATTLYSSSYTSNSNTSYEVKKPSSQENDPTQFDIPLGLSQDNQIRDLGFKSYVQIPVFKSVLKTGFEFTNHDLEYELRDNDDLKLRGKAKVNETSFFANTNFVLVDKLKMDAGLRSSYFEGTDSWYFSPRILARYEFSESLKFKSSFGAYQQFIREFLFEYRGAPKTLWVTAGQNDIPVLLSHNYMIGFSKVFEYLGVDVELYHKNFKGKTEYVIAQPGMGNQQSMASPRDYNLYVGDGFSRGVDVMLSSGYKNYETYMSYTLSESMERFKAIAMNAYYAAEDDRRHQLKWINSYRYRQFKLGVDYIFLSGRPYTDLQKLGPSGDVTSSQASNRFKRLDPYHRVDLSFAYRFKIFKLSSSISFSVLNVLNHENEKYIQNVSEDVGQNSESTNIIVGNESALLDRTINVSWKMQIGKR